MRGPNHGFALLLCLLFVASAAAPCGGRETWPCLCASGGLLSAGTQLYTGSEELGFTECSCPSAPPQGCQACPVGQFLDPSAMDQETMACSCTDPLFVIIQLLQQRLQNYTQNLEKAFKDNLATFLNLAPSQIFLSARRNGSVILDMYIFSSQGQGQQSLEGARDLLLQRNSSLDKEAWDSLIGQWKVLYLGNLPSSTGTSDGEQLHSWKDLAGRRLFLVALVLCASATAALLLCSLICLMYRKLWSLQLPCTMLWLDDENRSTQSLQTLLSNHQSEASTQSAYNQVYNNTCFNGTGCTKALSFRVNAKIGPVIGIVARPFTLSELREATGRFAKANIVGVGGSSIVYKGRLRDGQQVAIKKLNRKCGANVEREFMQEVELLSRLHHFHLVPLVGYCIEAHGSDLERLLVYEYMPNGNLREHLNQSFRKESLGWEARVKIALGAARGLEYLHEAANPRVLHRDFKSNNILLDSNWRAKVSDLGMATVVKEMDANTCPSSPAQMLGTFGYFAPEYAMMGRATIKSDVFSFGVVLLELISGRKPLERSAPLGQESLVVWALPMLRNRSRLLGELIDPALKQDLRLIDDDVWRMSYLASLCLQMDPESRPTMTFVVQALATMIPENCMQMIESEPLMEARAKVPRLLSWTRGHSFSRDDHSSSNAFQSDHSCGASNQIKDDDGNGHGYDDDDVGDDDDPQESISVPTRGSSDSSSSLAMDYLDKFSVFTPKLFDDIVARKSFDDTEADLLKPRLESFWQNNGLLVHEKSPTR